MVSTDDLTWTYCFHHLMARVDQPIILLQNIHNCVCTRLYGVLTQTTLWILTTVSTSNTAPNIIKNWNVDGDVTLGKLNYTRALSIFTSHLISHTFSTNCVHGYILHLKNKTEETNHFQYIHAIYDQDHICWISNFYYNCTTRKRNFWSWNKTSYMTMKRKGRLFKRWRSLCHTHNLNDSSNIIKWSTIISLRCHYFWHNLPKPWCICIILARFLQLSWQK